MKLLREQIEIRCLDDGERDTRIFMASVRMAVAVAIPMDTVIADPTSQRSAIELIQDALLSEPELYVVSMGGLAHDLSLCEQGEKNH